MSDGHVGSHPDHDPAEFVSRADTAAHAGYDVLIVGLGPVGAVLAALLGARGISVAVVEPAASPVPHPRAIAADDEMLRTLLHLPGLRDPLRLFDAGQRVEVRDARGGLITAVDFEGSPLGVAGLSFMHQPTLERELRAALVDVPNIDVHFGRSVTGVRDLPGAALIDLDDRSILRASFVVACDGAASTVRRSRGIGYAGRSFAEPWIVVDVDSEIPLSHLPYFTYVLDPKRPAVNMPRPGGHRFEFMVLPGEDPELMSGRAQVDRWLASYLEPLETPVRQGLRVVRAAVYTYHARTASRWRDGRVLLAGDAAHCMPPFGGQGLGAGIGDALALAWRVDEVCRQLASPALLDDYERERRPRIEEMTRTALIAGRLLTATTSLAGASGRLALRAVGRAPVLGSRFRAGALRAGPKVPVPPAQRRTRAGRPLPNPRVRTRRGRLCRLDDVLPAGWALIGRGSDPFACLPQAFADALRRRSCRGLIVTPRGGFAVVSATCWPLVEDLDGTLLGLWKGRPEKSLTLVRPDRFLAGVRPATELAAVFARLTRG